MNQLHNPAIQFTEAEFTPTFQTKLDLNKHLVKRAEATFFFRVEQKFTGGSGKHKIYPGCLLVIDRSIRARSGVPLLIEKNGRLSIAYLSEVDLETTVWGVVTYIIHKA